MDGPSQDELHRKEVAYMDRLSKIFFKESYSDTPEPMLLEDFEDFKDSFEGSLLDNLQDLIKASKDLRESGMKQYVDALSVNPMMADLWANRHYLTNSALNSIESTAPDYSLLEHDYKKGQRHLLANTPYTDEDLRHAGVPEYILLFKDEDTVTKKWVTERYKYLKSLTQDDLSSLVKSAGDPWKLWQAMAILSGLGIFKVVIDGRLAIDPELDPVVSHVKDVYLRHHDFDPYSVD